MTHLKQTLAQRLRKQRRHHMITVGALAALLGIVVVVVGAVIGEKFMK